MSTKSNTAGTSGAARIPSPCLSCRAGRLCLPARRSEADRAALGRLVARRHMLLRGEHLYQAGDSVRQRLYVVQHGQCKVYRLSTDGRQSVTGFSFAGDFLGLESIGAPLQLNSVVALTDAVLCEFPYPKLAEAAAQDELLAARLNHLLLTEFRREHAIGTLLGYHSADQRLAGFLHALSTRQRGCGDDGHLLELAMTRADIGDYLGLAPETVSRSLKRFQMLGYLAIGTRRLTILDAVGLRRNARRPS